MRWQDERYVRVYTRDTPEWLALSFAAKGLFLLLLRKVDRAGIMPIGKLGRRAVAIAVGHQEKWPELEAPLDELLEDGCVVIVGDRLVIPNFLEAQESRQSDAQRQRDSRERKRAEALREEQLDGAMENRLRQRIGPNRKGHIYVLRNVQAGRIKIGFTQKAVADRLAQLEGANGCALELITFFPGTAGEEYDLHKKFEGYRLDGEWFADEGPIVEWLESLPSSHQPSPPVTSEVTPVTTGTARHGTVQHGSDRLGASDETGTETLPTDAAAPPAARPNGKSPVLDAEAQAMLRLLPAKAVDVALALHLPAAAVDMALEELRGRGVVRLRSGMVPLWEVA